MRRVAGLAVGCLCIALPPRLLAKSYDFLPLPSDLLALSSSHLVLPPCVLALAPGVLALLLYVNTLGAHFVYDDHRAILTNRDVLPETPLANLWSNDFWGTPLSHGGSHGSYRPLSILTFRCNYAVAGFSPLGYHLVNILLHAVVTMLFVHAVQRVANSGFVAAISGFLFASHSIHTEAVAGVVGRAELLSATFFLLAFLCYVRYCAVCHEGRSSSGADSGVKCCNGAESDRRYSNGAESGRRYPIKPRWLYLAGAALCCSASMLSKEQGLTVCCVCAVYDVFVVNQHTCLMRRLRSVRQCEGLLALGLLSFISIVLRLKLMGFKSPDFASADNPASESDSLLTRSLTYCYLPCLNFWLLLCPQRLSFDWSMDAIALVDSLIDLRNCVTSVFYSVLGSLVLRSIVSVGLLRKTLTVDEHFQDSPRSIALKNSMNSRSQGSVLMALALLIFPFAPATNLFFYVGFVVAERVLYIPSMGFCWLVAEGVATLRQRAAARLQSRLISVLVALLILSLSIRTLIRNEDWRTEHSLYASGVDVNPAKAWGNLANVLRAEGKTWAAEQAYKKSLAFRPNMADVHYNLGILYQEEQRHSEAVASYLNAIHCRPNLTPAYLNLGIVYATLGLISDAETMFLKCNATDVSQLKDPRLHEQTKISALYHLGRLLADNDRTWEAVTVYMEAIDRRPQDYSAHSLYNMLGEAYFKLGELSEAERYYRMALVAKPDHVPAHLTLARLLHHQKKIESAEEWFLAAARLDPDDANVHQFYGSFLSDIGRHSEAAALYLKAAISLPTNFETIFNAANMLREAGQNLEAETYYRRASQLRPKKVIALMNLAAILHQNGKLQEAEAVYIQALKLKPTDTILQSNFYKLRRLLAKHGTK